MLNINDLKVVEKLKERGDTNSEVYRLEDKDGNFYVKKIIYGINQLPLYKGIFDRECGALDRLYNCEYIVRKFVHLVERIDDEDAGCIYMEYIDGNTLADRLNYGKDKEKLKIVKQLLCAVKAAHNNEIIHRDINPNNIMINYNNDVKVIDFGICKIKEMLNKSTTFFLGTDLYSAPEVRQGSSFATPQSDLYSVGAVMYYLFAGNPPPSSTDFSDCIDKNCCKSGDLFLKSTLNPIIKKLTKSDPKERYSCVEEVEEALSPLFKRYLEKSYIAVMDINGKFGRLQSMNLIKRDVKIWELDEYLSSDFSPELFIGRCKDRDSDNHLYEFMGKKILLKCRYEERDGYGLFSVISVSTVEPKDRENLKRRFCQLSAELKFIDSKKISGVEKDNCFEIKNIVDDHYEQLRSEENINLEFEDNFGVWNSYLDESRRREEHNVLRFKYDSRIQDGGILKFKLTNDSANQREDIEKLVKETRFSYENYKYGRAKKLIYIGDYESLDNDGGDVFLNIRLKNPKAALPAKGEICLDYRENVVNIDRQSYAFSRVKRENNPYYDLKGILAGVTAPGTFPLIKKVEFFNDDLNESQKMAVNIALATDSLAIIQGPPGTGKTSVIIEIIRQILQENQGNITSKKILLISQSHSAVDKMLEDLCENEPNLPTVVRIGRMEKLSPLVNERFSLDSIIGKWKKDVRDRCRKKQEAYCKELGVTVEDFERYFAEFEKQFIKSSESSKENEKPDQEILHAFESQTSDNEKIRKMLEIQKQWSDSLENCEDVEKYIIQSADIVAGTCTGFISNEYVRDMVFDYLIIDEAAKSTLTELAVSLYVAKKAILVGDHEQLPPTLDTDIVSKMDVSNEEKQKLYNSVFKLLYERIPNDNRITLDCQYRMHPTIGTLISSTFYNNLINNGVSEKDRAVAINGYEDTAIEWINTSGFHNRFESSYGDSYINNFEVRLIEKKLKNIDIAAGLAKKQFKIGVITAYGGQKRALKNMINRSSYNNIEVEVDTVDAFQGSQREIIIYSAVRSNKTGRIGFLKSSERLNVSLSRAQSLLIIIGDLDFLHSIKRSVSNFPDIIDYIKKKEYCRITDWSEEIEQHN